MKLLNRVSRKRFPFVHPNIPPSGDHRSGGGVVEYLLILIRGHQCPQFLTILLQMFVRISSAFSLKILVVDYQAEKIINYNPIQDSHQCVAFQNGLFNERPMGSTSKLTSIQKTLCIVLRRLKP